VSDKIRTMEFPSTPPTPYKMAKWEWKREIFSLRSLRRLLVTAKDVRSSTIVVTVMIAL
jgi:hypothetical protein